MFHELARELILKEDKPFASCHASHFAVLDDGTALAVWFAGSREGADDNAIWGARRSGGVWSEPRVLADEPDEPCWNPVLLALADGGLLLFYKAGREIRSWRTLTKRSSDGGRTWSEAAELVPGDRGGRGPVRNKAIVLADGAYLAPASTEDGVWRAFADRSDDGGRSWRRSGWIGIPGIDSAGIAAIASDIPVSEQSFRGRGVIQPSLWESRPGNVHMLLRSTEGQIYRSDSRDGGLTWTDAYPTGMPNNNSGLDVARLDDGTLVLACNPVGINWGPRTPLALFASRDNGSAWTQVAVLEDGAGEYSYPAVIVRGADVFLTYTSNRDNIAFRHLRLV